MSSLVELPLSTVDSWREALKRARADADWQQLQASWHAKRRQIQPEIGGFVGRFQIGEIEVEEFRETFDRKTRNDWDGFGLKGLSGAMFLNKLVKHLPERDEVSAELRKAIRVPADDASARVQIEGFNAFLDRSIRAGSATA